MNSNIFIDNCEFLTVENWKMTQFILSKFNDSVESITHVLKYLDYIWLWSMPKERGNTSLDLKDRGYFFCVYEGYQSGKFHEGWQDLIRERCNDRQWTKSKRKQHSEDSCSWWLDTLRMMIDAWFLLSIH